MGPVLLQISLATKQVNASHASPPKPHEALSKRLHGIAVFGSVVTLSAYKHQKWYQQLLPHT